MRDERNSLAPSATTSPNLEVEPLAERAAECFALIIVWSAREPSRVGEVALLTAEQPVPNPGMEEQVGLIGAANGSSLFLDEIGDMPEEVQTMFLRVTERHGEYFRLGEETRLQRSDLRLIGATNRPEKMRYELKRRFQRELRVPGLNQRKEDIPLLIQHLLMTQARDDDMDAARFLYNGHARLHPFLVEQLIHHTYKTHVSEITFLLGQAMAESDHDVIKPIGSELRLKIDQTVDEPVAPPPRRAARLLPSATAVKSALAENHGNVIRSARALNISRHQLNRLIQREGLVVPKSPRSPGRRGDLD